MSNTVKEILEHSHEDDIPILLWLFERYHMESEWQFVAECIHQRYGGLSYQVHRIWKPRINGRAIYHYFNGNQTMTEPTSTNVRSMPMHPEEQAARDAIPDHLLAGLDRYVKYGIQPGHFLTAMLSNDLMGTYGRADSTSKRYLEPILSYMYNYMPATCFGSIEAVNSWRGLDVEYPQHVE